MLNVIYIAGNIKFEYHHSIPCRSLHQEHLSMETSRAYRWCWYKQQRRTSSPQTLGLGHLGGRPNRLNNCLKPTRPILQVEIHILAFKGHRCPLSAERGDHCELFVITAYSYKVAIEYTPWVCYVDSMAVVTFPVVWIQEPNMWLYVKTCSCKQNRCFWPSYHDHWPPSNGWVSIMSMRLVAKGSP